MLDRDGSQILVIGPAIWRFGDQWNRDQSVLIVKMTDGDVADNTVYLRWSDLIGAPTCLVTAIHTEAVELTSPLFRKLKLNSAIENLMGSHWAGLSAAPLFLLGRSGSTVIAHALVRLGEHDGLFIRIGVLTYAGDAGDVIDIMPSVLRVVNENREFVNNHQCCFQKFWPDEELEHKITMLGPVDVHAVAVGLRNLVGTVHLPGTIWDYRDDYQLWDFKNYMFDIVGPPSEAGYVSSSQTLVTL